MKKFLTSLFSSEKKEETTASKEKADLKNFDILKYDGIRAMRMGRRSYAIKCFTEALNIQNDFEAMNHLATAYTMEHAYEEALDVLNDMVALESAHVATRLARVNILFLLDRDEEAIIDCQAVLEVEPDNHLAFFLMAKAKRAIKKPEEAIEELDQAISLKADFADAYLLRAELLLGIGAGEKALTDIEEVAEIAPDEELVFLLRGRIYESLGNPQAASADYQQALALNPFNEEACILAGKLLISLEKYDEAILFFDEAIEGDPQFARAYAERGRAKHLKGNETEAVEDLQKAHELKSENEEEFSDGKANFDDLYKGGIF
ncbi:tetratricopeptide repeat protein [Parabacteroides sp. PF5-9]|uniref:tetratricopeptide repeat protein n=1 Tax=Parabacteroides sp. PF5-9 TaxID=1742404 RepID=UPI002473CC81|nr:tetratricopeptide repeat protein [Parabacteroides sp. PF5-9]MDH6357962.1 tetratricopeptide (TPR) repeat protein [Parabacteroides sp. PF5-9]